MLLPNFKVTLQQLIYIYNLQNFQPTSFQSTIGAWADNPLQNATYISTLFGALGFLVTHNMIEVL